MKIYRIAHAAYCDTKGEGAKRYGGRWNLPGHPALYAGASISISLLERLTIDPELFTSERYRLYSVMEMDIPKNLIITPEVRSLPKDWDAIPAPQATQAYGTNLLKSGILCFSVPSVVDKTSLNFVVNPLSQHFHHVGIKTYPLQLDQRIVR